MIEDAGGAVRFEVRVGTRASRDAIQGEHEGAIKIALTAPPVSGAANTALVALIARLLGVAKREVSIVRGQSSRTKRIEVRRASAQAVRALLESRD